MKKVIFMWVPGQKQLLWDMEEEIQIEDVVNIGIDVDIWSNWFSKFFNMWLEEDCDVIFDINHPINLGPISFLQLFNQTNKHYKVYYWFDVDRDKNEKFEWKYCPISGELLEDLGPNYPSKNRLVSPKYPLVFPIRK